MPLETLDETAKQILDAASARFLHYGFKKTTMSEIADDCNMSTGNLYRYFPSKLDIAEAFVKVLRRRHNEKLRAVADRADLAAPEKLRAFFDLKFTLAYERFHDNPKAFELSAALIEARPKLALEWENAEGRVLSAILLEGRTNGDFVFDDAARTAKILQDAAFRFTSPAVFHEGDYADLSAELAGVMGFVLDGFRWRARRSRDPGADLEKTALEKSAATTL